MIELRWLSEGPTNPERPKLQYRYRLGGVGIALGGAPFSRGMGVAPNEGWSPWTDVPLVFASEAGEVTDRAQAVLRARALAEARKAAEPFKEPEAAL